VARQACDGRAIEGHFRPHENGADIGQLLARADRFREISRGESAVEAVSRRRQCRENDGSACDAIIGYDLDFIDTLPTLFPHADARSWFAGNDALIQATAFRNSTLQGAYLMLAARMLGLDCGPMSGFDQEGVDAAFFPGGRIKSNFLCNIGYGDASRDLFPRSPKPDFDTFASII